MHKSGLPSSLVYGLTILTGASLTLVAAPASADVEIAPLVVIDLSTFDGTGFAPEPAAGQLDSDDWSVTLSAPNGILDFGGTAGGPNSDFSRGVGMAGVEEPGIWAFDVDGAGLLGLGIQPTLTVFTPGQVALRLVNNTGADVTEIRVEYTLWVNNDEARANTLNLQESADHVTYTDVGAGFTSPDVADANGFTATDVVEVVTPADPIADGSQYYIAWAGDDATGDSLGRDEFAIEGITIRLLNVCGNGLMENDEACDDGLANIDTGACTSTCAVAACGDGFVQDGVEECDDSNTDPGDECAADCTIEEPGTTGADTTAGDTEADTSGSDSDSDSDTDVTATGASMTDATATSPTTSPTGGSDTDDGESEGGNGEDDDVSSCSCTSTSDSAPIWSVLGFIGLGLAARRRR